jgi:hypothetical protein
VQLVLTRDDEQLVGAAGPERRHADRVIAGEHDPLAVGELGLDGGTEDACALETSERPLLLEHLAGDDGQTEQLAVGMGEGCACLATVIEDCLRVADVGGAGVIDQAALERLHDLRHLVIVGEMDAAEVVRRVHEDFVDAARLRHHVNRPEVMNGERIVAVERGIKVRNDAQPPGATFVDLLERGWRLLFATWAERARPRRIGFDLDDARRKVGWPLRPIRHDCDPPPGEGIQTHLRHCQIRIRRFGAMGVETSRIFDEGFVTPLFGIHQIRALHAHR